MPVEMLVAFTRVTVGKTECECVYQTPAVFRRSRFGIVAGVIESGRSPSMTRTITSAGRSTAAGRERHVKRSRIVVFMIAAASHHFPTQSQAALKQGKLSGFSIGRLMRLLLRLGSDRSG